MRVYGIRGAITVERNTPEDIINAAQKLLLAIVEENEINTSDIASIFLTLTPDLNAQFPALAARQLGWRFVPLLCAREIGVPGAMARVIRVLVHVNTEKSQQELKHIYLGDAVSLREDLNEGVGGN